jgi:diguanylate cyclase (GGDEF)-like protein/PAS domain S-box-containing protein
MLGTDPPRPVSLGGVRLPDAMVDALQEGVLICDAQGVVVDVNEAAGTILTLTREQVLGVNLATLEHDASDEDGAPVAARDLPVALARRTNQPASTVVKVRGSSPEPLWLRATAIPFVPTEQEVWCMVTLTDVTGERRAALRLRHSEETFRLTFEDAPIGMAIVALDGRYLEVNRALTESLRRTREELLDTTFEEITHPEDIAIDLEHGARLLDGSLDSFQVDKRYVTPDGETMWARLTVSVVRDGDGTPVHFVNQIEDVTEMRLAQEQLERRALYDHLTGLANRSLLLDRLAHALTQHARTGNLVAVAFADLDHFKRLNDSLGHDAGDRMLRAVAERMSAAVRPGDTVARIGGDEFVVVLEGVDSSEHAGELLDRILAAVELPLHVDGHEVVPRLSAGLTVNDGTGVAEEVLRDADTALYVAKDAGRSRWEVFHDVYRRDALRRLSVETELRTALERGSFVLHYQPIVELDGRRTVAHEALVRWMHPRRGLLLPGEFVQIAEDSDLINGIGAWVLNEAVEFLARHPELPGKVYINVSPRQLGRGTPATEDRPAGLAPLVAGVLRRHDVPATRLGIEITENGVLQASEQTREDLEALADLGVELLLDDFGTGFSALTSVLSTPVSGLKLDRSFTVRLGDGAACDRISTAMAALVDSLSSHGVVEGIETEKQWALALGHGWTHGQGWLFGHAVAESALFPALDEVL